MTIGNMPTQQPLPGNDMSSFLPDNVPMQGGEGFAAITALAKKLGIPAEHLIKLLQQRAQQQSEQAKMQPAVPEGMAAPTQAPMLGPTASPGTEPQLSEADKAMRQALAKDGGGLDQHQSETQRMLAAMIPMGRGASNLPRFRPAAAPVNALNDFAARFASAASKDPSQGGIINTQLAQQAGEREDAGKKLETQQRQFATTAENQALQAQQQARTALGQTGVQAAGQQLQGQTATSKNLISMLANQQKQQTAVLKEQQAQAQRVEIAKAKVPQMLQNMFGEDPAKQEALGDFQQQIIAAQQKGTPITEATIWDMANRAVENVRKPGGAAAAVSSPAGPSAGAATTPVGYPRVTPQEQADRDKTRLDILYAEQKDQASRGAVDPALAQEIAREEKKQGVQPSASQPKTLDERLEAGRKEAPQPRAGETQWQFQQRLDKYAKEENSRLDRALKVEQERRAREESDRPTQTSRSKAQEGSIAAQETQDAAQVMHDTLSSIEQKYPEMFQGNRAANWISKEWARKMGEDPELRTLLEILESQRTEFFAKASRQADGQPSEFIQKTLQAAAVPIEAGPAAMRKWLAVQTSLALKRQQRYEQVLEKPSTKEPSKRIKFGDL